MCGAEEPLLREPHRVEDRATQGQGAPQTQERRHPRLHKAAGIRGLDVCAEISKTHARRLYSSAENPAMEGARALLERIRKGEVNDGDSTRSVYRRHWAKLSTP